jgi:hypothetical protein
VELDIESRFRHFPISLYGAPNFPFSLLGATNFPFSFPSTAQTSYPTLVGLIGYRFLDGAMFGVGPPSCAQSLPCDPEYSTHTAEHLGPNHIDFGGSFVQVFHHSSHLEGTVADMNPFCQKDF